MSRERIYPEDVFRGNPILMDESWVGGFYINEYQGRVMMSMSFTPKGMAAISAIADCMPLPDGVKSPAPVNHQDEALAAARRDANEAKQRAAAAEALVETLREEVADYQGELEVAKEDRTILAVDPGSVGGVVVATSRATGYTHAQQKAAFDIYMKAEEERQRRERAKIFQEPWHTEYGFDGSMATFPTKTIAELEREDPFTYGDR